MTNLLLDMKDIRIEDRSDRQWKPIIKGVDLQLKRGEILGLIGESGAGKSTLGLAAMGYTKGGCRISGGSISFDGIELAGASTEALRQLRGKRIAYVAQSAAAAFNPAFKLINQYCEAPVQHGVMSKEQAKKDAKELYRKIRLPNPDMIGFRYPHQVSGGQLQRAMTAMAMACRPDLIIFDEPTTALDVTTQIEVLAAIRDIVCEYNTAAIYITHDLAVVAQMADQIKVLLRGNEVEQAPAREMLSNPKEDYTKSLWAVRDFRRAPAEPRKGGETTLVDIKNIHPAYGTVKVLDNINLTIKRGSTVAIVGESGSGKSTLAPVVMGLLPQLEGDIAYNGAALHKVGGKRPRGLQRNLQMIHQMADTALNPKQKIKDIIARRLYGALNPDDLTGRLILAPSLNMPAVQAISRTSPLDGGNLNRSFSGAGFAGPTQDIAGFIATHLIANADLAIDIHSGGRLSNYVDTAYFCLSSKDAQNQQTHDLAKMMGLPYTMVVPVIEALGDFDNAAHAAGCAMISCELGGEGKVSLRALERGWQAVLRPLAHQGVLTPTAADRLGVQPAPATQFLDLGAGAAYLTAQSHAMIEPLIILGDVVKAGQPLAQLRDLYNMDVPPQVLTSPTAGVVSITRTSPMVATGDHVCMVCPPLTGAQPSAQMARGAP